MSHKLLKFYESFQGLDTRSNKLSVDPKTFRTGTKNYRVNALDEIQKANGFQHKSLYGFTSLGDIEYRYTDLNTGEAKVQYLSVGSNGNLYRRKSEYVNFSSLGTSTSYSFYYDEVSDNFIFKLNSYAAITVSLTTTMDQLRTSINALGATCTIVDDDGNTVTGSTKLAYYMDVVINQALTTGRIDEMNSQYWEEVPYPSKYISLTKAPFFTSKDFNTNENYEGISYINLNNVCYITDGGWPMKYDGNTVYRVNMPKVLQPRGDSNTVNFTGFSLTSGKRYDGELTPDSVYKYVFQYGFIDAQGSEIIGAFDLGTENLYLEATLSNVQNFVAINIPQFEPNANFPYYSVEVVGNQDVPSAGGTINVNALHNIEVGMNMRLPITNAEVSQTGYSFIYSRVSAVERGYQDTAVTTNGSAVITGLVSTSEIGVGAVVSGTNIPANATVLSVDSATQITISANATGTGTITLTASGRLTLEKGYTSFSSNAKLYPFQRIEDVTFQTTSGSNLANSLAFTTLTGDLTSGSPIITNINTTGLEVGMFIFQASIGGSIISIDSPTQVTMSANATGTGAGASLPVKYNLVNKLVFSPDIPLGTTVVSQIAGNVNSLTLSQNATGTNLASVGEAYEYGTLLANGQNLNGGFTQNFYQNTITDVNLLNTFLPPVNLGPFIRIWRTTADTDIFYKLADVEIPQGSAYTFVDTFADAVSTTGLSRIALIDSDQGSELPRACKFITEWQDQIVQMGRPVDTTLKDEFYPTFFGAVAPINAWGEDSNQYTGYLYGEIALCDYQSIYWNDTLSPEGFPVLGLNEFRIESNFDDEIRGGLKNKDAFFAFKDRSTGVLVGSLADNTLQLELLEDDIGCASHRSIQEVNGAVVWLDGVNGFYACVAGRLPQHIGYPISDYQKINSTRLNYRKAVAANFRKENIFVCAVESTTFVYDYNQTDRGNRSQWYIWDRFNTKSLIATSNDQLLLNDGVNQWKMKVTNTKYDFTDHTTAINMVLNTNWANLGVPTIDKQFINLWVSSIQGDFTLDFKQYQNYLDYSLGELTAQPFLIESSAKKLVKVPFKANINKMSGVSFGMENNVKNAFVRIQGYEIEYSPSFDSGEPKK
jgi:hypothetical protein